jgi:hypothetical protein
VLAKVLASVLANELANGLANGSASGLGNVLRSFPGYLKWRSALFECEDSIE